jgi:hypothetical protein
MLRDLIGIQPATFVKNVQSGKPFRVCFILCSVTHILTIEATNAFVHDPLVE